MPETVRIAVVSASASEFSRSRVGARRCVEAIVGHGAEADLIDLADLELAPYPRSADDPRLVSAMDRFNSANGWVLATPVYNFGPSGTLLTFLHYALAGDEGERWRPFCILASLAGLRSAMATDSLARTIIHERASVQVGPPILGTGSDLNGTTGEVSAFLSQRIDEQMSVLVAFARARRGLNSVDQGSKK